MATLSLLLATLVSYAVGSIPPGYLVARLFGNVDLLQKGSGRTGTTNVLRTLGWKAAGLVFLGDFAKGAVAIIATRIITGGDPLADLLAGLAVMVGHNYSLYLGFKGGRGVVTGLGVLAAIAPLVLAICGGIGVVVIALSRYVSLGSILGSAAVPFCLLALVLIAGQPWPHLAYGLIGAAFVIVSHRDNIQRLLSGTERKLGQRT